MRLSRPMASYRPLLSVELVGRDIAIISYSYTSSKQIRAVNKFVTDQPNVNRKTAMIIWIEGSYYGLEQS